MIAESYLGVSVHWTVEVAAVLGSIYVALLVIFNVYFARYHKFRLPGPLIVPPVLGELVVMIRDPTGFWDKQVEWAR